METIMIYIAVVIMIAVMWYPGFMLSRNVIIAVRGDKPTAAETIIALFPGFQLANARKEFYGSATLVYVVNALVYVAVAQRYIFYLLFPEAIFASLVSLIVTWGALVIAWLFNGYILFDTGTCSQCGMLSKVLAFVIPPLSSYLIGKNCIPLIRQALEEGDSVTA